GANAVVRIAENPAPYLNTVLLLVLLVQLGGTTLASVVAVRHLHRIGELVATIAMTLLLFVFAEVTPKVFAVQQTDRAALRLSPLLVVIAGAVGPFANGLIRVANAILPGRGLPQGPFVTEEEIKAMAEVASEEEVIEEEEKDLIHSIFEFGDTLVREVMVPRPDIVAAPVEGTTRQVQDLILRHGYSRIPVYRGELDEVVGVVYAKDIVRHYRVNGRLSIDDVNDLLDVELPHDEWDTVAGLMYGMLGAVPTQGEMVSYDNLTFTAEKVQGRRIAKVLLSRKDPEEAAGEGAG